MIYINDIELNLNNNYYEFFEWNKLDKIKFLKKVLIVKTNNKVIDDIINNIVLFDNDFINKVKSNIILLTSNNRCIGILISNRKAIKISDILLSDLSDILFITKNIKSINVSYNIIEKRNYNLSLTRYENNIKDYLYQEFTNYKDNNIDKLKYIYYEYFNSYSDNMYNELVDSLDDFNCKHVYLYNLLKSVKKQVNLT